MHFLKTTKLEVKIIYTCQFLLKKCSSYKNVRKQSRVVILQREAPRVNGSDVASCE